ncbi:MAG TPA: hypothetical protein VGI45_30115 [Terracidiphilus sp.]|jgi:hypothetical protein
MGLISKLLRRETTRDGFAHIVIRHFSKSGIGDFEYREADFSIQRPGTSNAIFLHNVFQNYCQADAQGRETILARFVNAFAAESKIPSDFESAKAGFMPVLRDFRYISLSHLALESRSTADIHLTPELPFAPELNILCACDFQDSMSLVNQDKLQSWGVSLEAAVQIAKENLRDRTDPSGFTELRDGVHLGTWNDSYESARLILTDYFYRIPLQGDPVAFIPNRDILFVCGELDTGAMSFIVEEGAKTHFENGYPLSPNLYVLRDGKWELFLPDEPMLRRRLLEVQKRREATDYTEQQKYLNAIYGREKEEIFVAGCQLYKKDDGTYFTHTVWSRDVDSLLPVTDEITLFLNPEAPEGDSSEFLRVPWEKACNRLGSLMEPIQGMVPRRVRVRSFPDEQMLEELTKPSGF